MTIGPQIGEVNLSPTEKIRLLKLAAALCAFGFTTLRPALAADAAQSADTAAAASGSGAGTGSDEVVRLNEVEVMESADSAQTLAPTDGKLDAMEPTTIISAQTLNNEIAPTADYATIANIAPSIANVETEGPGLSESKMLSMRGFQDGQYNVTYDGIPFGDANGQTHHTTSYFPAKVLGGEVIDRGPGTAADIGENTFGGTIGLLSKDPRPDQATVLTLSDGSWNTFLGNLEVNTGDLPQLNGGSMVATYQYMSSDTYRTFSYLQRNTYYLKYLQPIGKNAMLTVVGNYNNIKFNNPGAVTQAQINAYGRNFGLDANPFDPNNDYYPYNYQQKQADFEYIGLKAKLGSDITLDDKAYTYAYNNDSHENSTDPVVGGTTKFPGTTAPTRARPTSTIRPTRSRARARANESGITSNDDPGGRIKVNAYRAVGDYLALSHGEDTSLEEKVGIWAEYEVADRYAYDLDYSPAYLAANPQDAYTFGAFDPTSGYKNNTYKPGWRMVHARLQQDVPALRRPDLEAAPEPHHRGGGQGFELHDRSRGSGQPDTDCRRISTNNTYTNVEPHFSANYAFTPNWSAYVQWAKGIAYPIVTDEENIPNDPKDLAATGTSYNPGNLKEETTINYQLGTVYKTDKFNADADVYLINIDNLVSSVTDPNDSTNTLFFQSKGAWVSGVEAEGTYYVGGGLSVYANGSLNRAVYQDRSRRAVSSMSPPWAPSAPTACRIRRPPWARSTTTRAGSLRSTDKYVGPFVVYSSALVNPDLGLYGQTSTGQPGGTPIVPVQSAEDPGFWMMDFAGGYAFKLPKGSFVHSIKIKLQVDNVLNRKVQVLSSVGCDTRPPTPTTCCRRRITS